MEYEGWVIRRTEAQMDDRELRRRKLFSCVFYSEIAAEYARTNTLDQSLSSERGRVRKSETDLKTL